MCVCNHPPPPLAIQTKTGMSCYKLLWKGTLKDKSKMIMYVICNCNAQQEMYVNFLMLLCVLLAMNSDIHTLKDQCQLFQTYEL